MAFSHGVTIIHVLPKRHFYCLSLSRINACAGLRSVSERLQTFCIKNSLSLLHDSERFVERFRLLSCSRDREFVIQNVCKRSDTERCPAHALMRDRRKQ